MQFNFIESAEEIAESFIVMRHLRTLLNDQSEYCRQIERQKKQGYRLLGCYLGDRLAGLAGYRFLENLLYGRFVYVDDLVVEPASQRKNVGERLIEQVREDARSDGRGALVLDTGLANPLAQRFYFRNGLLPRGLHFSQPIQSETGK